MKINQINTKPERLPTKTGFDTTMYWLLVVLMVVSIIFINIILPASALIPADNISDNKSYVAENNTNTSFDPENHEIFEAEDTVIPAVIATTTSTSIKQSSGSNGGSGGGGGSGGLSPSENSSNILQFEQHDGTLIAGQPVSFKFNLSVYEILLIGKENEYDVSVRVELLKDKPQIAIVKPEGEVIQYFNVATSTKRLKEAVIRLKSNQSAELLKWNNSKWVKSDMVENVEDIGLKIPQECIDEQQICYTYQTDSFLSFAIVKRETYITQTPSEPSSSISTPLKTTIPIQSPIPKQASGFDVSIVITAFIFALFISGSWQLRKKS